MEFVIWLLIAGLIGAAIGQARGRATAGFWWGFLLGPIGWLIVLLGSNPKKEKQEAERRSQEVRMEKMQEAHLAELRALRGSLAPAEKVAVSEDRYLVRLNDRDIGPIGKVELLELYSSGKITLETQIARDADSEERVYRFLSDEIPALRKA